MIRWLDVSHYRDRINVLETILAQCAAEAEWNLENPGNEDDTLENIVNRAIRAGIKWEKYDDA